MPGSTKEQILERLHPHQACILNFSTVFGHAATIKHFQGEWYLIDSLKHQPILLNTPRKWASIQGHTYTLQPGQPNEAWLDHNPINPMEEDLPEDPMEEDQATTPTPAVQTTQTTHRTNLPYWEPQIDSNCQIHSINIYLGYKALDLDEILDFSVKLDTHVRNYTCQQWTLEGHYDSLTGNYSSNLINFYLSSNKSHLGLLTKHTNPRYIPHHISPHTEIAGTSLTYSEGIMLGSSQMQILQRIPTNCSCFLLHYHSGYGHAKAIKQLDGEWWDMNSEGPYPLKPPDWQHLQGHIYTLTDTSGLPCPQLFQPEIYYEPNNPTQTIIIDLPTTLTHNATDSSDQIVLTDQMDLTDSSQLQQLLSDLPHPTDHIHPADPTEPPAPTETVDLVSDDEEPPKSKKPKRTSTRCNPTSLHSNSTHKSPTTKKTPRDTTQPPKTNLPIPTRPAIPDSNKMRQSRIFGAEPPTKKPTPPRLTTKTLPTKRIKITHTTSYPVQQQQTALYLTNIITSNCRGIFSSWETLYDHIRTNEPDIAILTETKLTSNNTGIINMIKQDLSDYHFHHSSKTIKQATNADNIVTRSAGVITLIKKTLTTHPIKHEVPTDIAGHLTHQTINNTTHILGVYMPCNDPAKRARIYEHIHYIISQNPSHHYIAGGDWNAAYYLTDRSNTIKHLEDQPHYQHLNKYPIHIQPSPRPHTYSDNTSYSSRIDDIILINPPTATTVTETAHQMGDTLDHLTLEQHITSSLFPPPNLDIPPHNPTPQLQLPLKQQDMAKAKEAISNQFLHQFQHSHINIDKAWTIAQTLLGEDKTSAHIQSIRQELKATIPEDLNSMTNHLMVTLHQALSIMTDTCPTKPSTPGTFLPRQTAKTYRRLNYHIKHIKALRTASNHLDQQQYMELRSTPHTAGTYSPTTKLKYNSTFKIYSSLTIVSP